MPNTVPQATTQQLLQDKFTIASKTSYANYSFMFGGTNDNLEELLKTDPKKVAAIKLFLGSSTGNMLVDNEETLEKIFSSTKMLIAVHCEDEETIRRNLADAIAKYGDAIPIEMHPEIRSEEACYISSSKAVALAKKTGARLHVFHLSTAKETALFRNDIPLSEKQITAEVCIHHLWFDDSYYKEKGTFIKWNPAVKTKQDNEGLWKALLNDHIDVIATDHAPHTLEEKSQVYTKAPSGGPLVQHALLAMLEKVKAKKISFEKLVEKMCHNPAILFQIQKRGFIKKVNITTSSEGGGSRPEVVATKKRVFVIYHGNIKKGRRPTFNVKIFDSSMEKEILTRVLINSSRKYGNVTDSRVASDGKYLYLFYETANMRVGKSFLWGAKYKLDDSFKRVAYTHIPIVTSVTFNVAEYGDEKLDDPAPVVSTDFVFVITRYKTTFKKSGKTIYKVRKFNKELKKLKEFDIDLTSVVDGQARQMSVVYHQDYFYMVTPTTVGEVRVEAALATPSDIVLVKFDKNWKILWSKTISAEPDDTETYVTGFKMDKNRLYITYNQRKFGISSPLKIYDHKFHQLRKVKVASLGRRKKRLRPSFGEGLRPSLDVFGNRIFLGNNEGENAVVYIYDKNKIEE